MKLLNKRGEMMEVLHYEVITLGLSMSEFIVGIVLSLISGICFYKGNSKSLGVLVPTILILFLTSGYLLTQEQYEYQKVKVSDWNTVHEQGWEVIKQEGEIVELKRKLEENE